MIPKAKGHGTADMRSHPVLSGKPRLQRKREHEQAGQGSGGRHPAAQVEAGREANEDDDGERHDVAG